MNITINKSNTGSSSVTACDEYTWEGTKYTSSASPTHKYTNVANCDSVHTLNLIINKSPTVSLLLKDDACLTDTAFVLAGGTPSGGMYTGTGVDSLNGTFDAKTMGLGRHLVTYIYEDRATGCSDTAQDSLTVNNCYRPYCSYTQGFWGNAGGKVNTCDSLTNGLGTTRILALILKDTTVVIGDTATSCSDKWRSFSIFEKDTLNILAVLPAGGPSKKLDVVKGKCNGSDWETKYDTRFTSASGGSMSPTIRTKKSGSTIANTLVGQTMALSFNVLFDKGLSSLILEGDTIHTAKSLNCDSGKYTPAGSPQKHALPATFRAYFSGNYSVGDLLELANNALSGKYVPSGSEPSLSDLTSALATINEAFDECRLLTKFTTPNTSRRSLKSTKTFENQEYAIKAYPNPFNGKVTINIESEKDTKAELSIYNILGKLVYTTKGNCVIGNNNFDLNTQKLSAGIYLVKVRIGQNETNIKMLKSK